MSKKRAAEFIGTVWPVPRVCGDRALARLRLFRGVPFAGAMAAGFLYRWLGSEA